MAFATQASRGPRDVKTYLFSWEGLDKNNKTVRGDLRAASETVVTTTLRRQGIRVIKVKRLSLRGGGTIKDRNITVFTRQRSTMASGRRNSSILTGPRAPARLRTGALQRGKPRRART